MQRDKEPKAPATSRTPVWVWAVYVVGIFAATVLVGSTLFTIGALYLSNEGSRFSWNVSVPAFVLWGLLTLGAAALWISRRRRR
jgi:LPXTG-motif cell wall-anchored protein